MLRFTLDPEPTAELAGELLGCWAEVTNAGGAVGFTPPVTPDDIRPAAESVFARCRPDGPDHLLAGFDGTGVLACWAVLRHPGGALRAHWRWLIKVMVHPKHQGKGYGAALLAAADEAARGLGVEALQLTCRGGTGVDAFYARSGWAVTGRVPGSIRIAPGEDREEIYMIKRL